MSSAQAPICQRVRRGEAGAAAAVRLTPRFKKTQRGQDDSRGHIPISCVRERRARAAVGRGAAAGGAVAEKDSLPVGILTTATVPR